MTSLFTTVVAAASGIKDSQVAWKAVAKDTGRFLPSDALPDAFVFQNPKRMAAQRVKELWEHILELQAAGNRWEDRFHWTHWWKRVGQGEDSGERLEASYGPPPRPKHIVQGTRKGHAVRTKRAPPRGAFGLNRTSEESSASEEEAPAKGTGGKKKTKSKSQQKDDGAGEKASKKKTTATRSKGKAADPKGRAADPKGKGKAKAGDESASAESSGVGTAGEEEPELEGDDSPDTIQGDEEEEEETFDLRVSDPDLSTASPGLDADGNPVAGPSRPKKRVPPRPVRKTKNPPVIHPPEGSPDSTPEPEAMPAPFGPWDDAPVGRHGLGTGRIPPRNAIVAAARGHPPSWVENDPERVLPFLWYLSAEVDYRNFLRSWCHMVRITRCVYVLC